MPWFFEFEDHVSATCEGFVGDHQMGLHHVSLGTEHQEEVAGNVQHLVARHCSQKASATSFLKLDENRCVLEDVAASHRRRLMSNCCSFLFREQSHDAHAMGGGPAFIFSASPTRRSVEHMLSTSFEEANPPPPAPEPQPPPPPQEPPWPPNDAILGPVRLKLLYQTKGIYYTDIVEAPHTMGPHRYTCHDMGIIVADEKNKNGSTKRTITPKEPPLVFPNLHPAIFLEVPAHRIRVHLVDEHTGHVYWDAYYTIGNETNRFQLGNKLMSNAIPFDGDAKQFERICLSPDDPQVHKFNLTVETLDDPLADDPHKAVNGEPWGPMNGRDEGFKYSYAPEQIEFEAVRLPIYEKDGEPPIPPTPGKEPSFPRVKLGRWNKYCARAKQGGCASWGHHYTLPYETRAFGQRDDFMEPGKLNKGTGYYSKPPYGPPMVPSSWSNRGYYDHIITRTGRMWNPANPLKYLRAWTPEPMSPGLIAMKTYWKTGWKYWKTDPETGAEPTFPSKKPTEHEIRPKTMEAALELQKEPKPPPEKDTKPKIEYLVERERRLGRRTY